MLGDILGDFNNVGDGSNQNGSTSINDVVISVVVRSVVAYGFSLQSPVVFSGKIVVGEVSSGILWVNTSQNEGRSFLSSISGQEEGEGVILNSLSVPERDKDGINFINRDSWPGHTQNSVEFRNHEGKTFQFSGFSDIAVISRDSVSKGNGIVGPETFHTSGSVGDIECGVVSLVGGGFGVVVFGV